jgi:tubulin epsilon
MAVQQLREHADCVLPIENQALIHICNRVHNMQGTPAMRQTSGTKTNAARSSGTDEDQTPFHEMDNLAALLVSTSQAVLVSLVS